MDLQQSTGTILVVDDEQLVSDIAREILQHFGYTVLAASDGETALAVYQHKSSEIDAVVLDMVMPSMDGPEVFRRLVQINPRVRVILSSGYAQDHDRGYELSQKAAGFIQKPYRMADLVNAVGNAVGGQQATM